MKFGIGQSVHRMEDARFLTGGGRFLDDIVLANQVHACFVRSPEPHADIISLDIAAALGAPGVVAVLTGEDAAADGLGNMPRAVEVENRDGSTMGQVPRPLLVRDRVRHVGDAVAMVVAETASQARDAADLVRVDYKSLASVTDAAKAVEPGAAQVWSQAPGNIAYDWEIGDRAATDAAFARAAHITRLDLINNRLVSNPMETRGAIGEYDAAAGRYRLTVGSQGVFSLRRSFAESVFRVPLDKFHVLTPDVGGGFGTKAFPYPEYGLVAWAAKRLGRPVKWVADRAESFLTDAHGRDHHTTAELALDADGGFLGVRVSTLANMGAYLQRYSAFISALGSGRMLAGVYTVPAVYANVRGVFTNTVPVDAYRGAGRPEAAFCVERLVDTAAREMGLAPDEIRRRNFIPPEAMPYRTPTGLVYDSGEFAGNLKDALDKAEWRDFPARRGISAAAGALRGIGLAYYVEITDGGSDELARLRLDGDGKITVWVGTQSTGQGHDTAYAQIVAERLGLDFADIEVRQGDSEELEDGGGTGGSRSVVTGGGAITLAAAALIEKARRLAGDRLEAAEADLEFEDGRFTIAGTDRSVSLVQLAEDSDLEASGAFGGGSPNFPNGAHICELEIDPETGRVTILRYTVVDDFGKVLNPMLLAGQVHGGIGQGLGQALLEHCVYDHASGQLMTGSMLDYAMPRADDFPGFDVSANEIPCQTNWLGAKGAGEAGSVGAPPALVNAVVDALHGHGLRHVDMPVWPERLWRIIQAREDQAEDQAREDQPGPA